MEEVFNKKAASRELVLHKGVNEMVHGGGYDLTRSKPEEYSVQTYLVNYNMMI